jgi:DNA-3-methyladenine glycosylase II
VLFHSPYEAAAWSIISARRPAGVAARWRTEIAERFGERFELDGATLAAFPQPDRLAGLPDDIGGIGPEKAERLRALAATALTGALDAAHLQDLGPPDAYAEVQRLKGIGPFYATLIVLRATGFADAPLPVNEPRVLTHAARLYGLAAPPSAEALSELAEAWTPFRTWTLVLIRMAGERGTF